MTDIQKVIEYFFLSKGIFLSKVTEDKKKQGIIYARHTRPAKQLLELAGSPEEAIKAIDILSQWANSRSLEYTIETVSKKWLELDRLKPKEVVKKPFYMGNPMICSENKKKWYVIIKGEWLEFADKQDKIEWKIVK